ncbi:CDP-alcohol phosphatidyltransferase [Paenibacillus algicola]|uniref:CDP-alcohol phosphatidyltransferase n=1 Tax=Paenibacillus algicola TaxID=2565926 RepID=A0A4P8XJY1_9BACL|nr:CDP-alcohol phosphatidyltransferase family protein [Paenibacillus algicola]QCT02966.1 CDP-alcohol phosphatidyltransferase [Paenibacillus algicola]
MLDSYARNTVQPIIHRGAIVLHKAGLSANAVSWIAMTLGVGSAAVFLAGYPAAAVVMLWLSGYLDAVDGTIARMTKPSKWGNVLDIVFDRIVEGAMMSALVLAYSGANAPLILSLAGILVVVTTFLVTGNVIENSGIKGFHYNPGILERTESFAFFTVMMLFSSVAFAAAWIFFSLLVLTAIKHLWDVYTWLKRHGA